MKMRRKMNMILTAVVTSIAALSLPMSETQADGRSAFSRISNNDGLSNSSVTCIFQGRDSVMWFGTWDGLNRYDGMSIKQYRPKPGASSAISHQVIRSVAEDLDGNLWIATDYGINRLDKDTDRFKAFFLGKSRPEIYEENTFSCCISGGGVIAAAYKGRNLHIFDRAADDFVPVSGCEGLRLAAVLLFGKDGNLWAESVRGVLYRISLDGNRAMDISAAATLPDNAGASVCDELGRLWVQIGHGLHFIDTGNPGAGLQDSGISAGGKLNAIACTEDGKIIVCTTEGCFRLAAGRPEKLIADISVLSARSSSQDILWLGTDGKGILYDSPQADFISSLPLPGSHPVRAITMDRRGRLFIGSKGGGLTIVSPDGRQEKHNVGEGRSYNSVLALANGPGCIYIGTDGYGLKYYDTLTGNIRDLDLSSPDDGKHICSVYSIVPDSTGLWAGTSGEGLFRIDIGRDKAVTGVKRYVHSESDPASIGSNIIYDIVDDGECLWLATRGGGLNKFCKSTCKSLTFKTLTGGGQFRLQVIQQRYHIASERFAGKSLDRHIFRVEHDDCRQFRTEHIPSFR